MITDSPYTSGARPETTDPEAVYRADFRSLLGRLDLEPARTIAFVEAATGSPFETCTPRQLVPLLQKLLELLRSSQTPVDAKQLEP